MCCDGRVRQEMDWIGNDGNCKLIKWPDMGSWTSAQTPLVVHRAANNCPDRPSVFQVLTERKWLFSAQVDKWMVYQMTS